MSNVPIHPPSATRAQEPSGSDTLTSPLPPLLHTPLGLALVELQGNINYPSLLPAADSSLSSPPSAIPVGKLVFPDYRGEGKDGDSGAWTKRVWLYVGEHQRMTGAVKKLGTPLGVLRKKKKKKEKGEGGDGDDGAMEGAHNASEGSQEELEIAEIIRWKIVFTSRPEPVGVSMLMDTE